MWSSLLSREKMAEVVLKLDNRVIPGLLHRCFFVSEVKKTTALVLVFDEDHPGFYRNYFAKS